MYTFLYTYLVLSNLGNYVTFKFFLHALVTRKSAIWNHNRIVNVQIAHTVDVACGTAVQIA